MTEEGVVIENGDRVSLEDGCNSCTCADGTSMRAVILILILIVYIYVYV